MSDFLASVFSTIFTVLILVGMKSLLGMEIAILFGIGIISTNLEKVAYNMKHR